MKEKLLNTLGAFGGILWFILSTLIYVIPFVMIGASFWLNLLLLGIVYFIPSTSVIFWVWGLVCAIQGSQDVWAILYYILFAIGFVPFFVSLVLDFFGAILKTKAEKKAKKAEEEYPDFGPGIHVDWGGR